MKVYLEEPEIILMEEAAFNLRDRLLVRLLFRLGCRVSEALSIKVDDIDFNTGTITIIHLKSRLKLYCPFCRARIGVSQAFCPSCGSKIEKSQTEEQQQHRRRVLPIDGDTLKMLKEYVDRGGPIVKNGKKLIFGINRHRAWQIIKQCAEKAGLPKLVNPETGRIHNISPHRLRNALAVHAVKLDDSGDGLRMLQEHLGLQSFNTTAKYRKVVGEQRQAVRRGDLIRAGAMVTFSPISTIRPLVQNYVLRLACTNGMTSRTVLAEYRSGGEGDNIWQWFRESVRGAYQSLGAIVNRYREMLQERILADQRAAMLEAMLRQASITGENAEVVRARAIEEPPRNAYDLMNLVTWASSHVIREPRRIQRALSAAATFTDEQEHARVCPVCHVRR